jgi:hypothetical protein
MLGKSKYESIIFYKYGRRLYDSQDKKALSLKFFFFLSEKIEPSSNQDLLA